LHIAVIGLKRPGPSTAIQNKSIIHPVKKSIRTNFEMVDSFAQSQFDRLRLAPIFAGGSGFFDDRSLLSHAPSEALNKKWIAALIGLFRFLNVVTRLRHLQEELGQSDGDNEFCELLRIPDQQRVMTRAYWCHTSIKMGIFSRKHHPLTKINAEFRPLADRDLDRKCSRIAVPGGVCSYSRGMAFWRP
jgi:hypothetical protein